MMRLLPLAFTVPLLLLLGASTPAHGHYVFAWATETRKPAAGWYVSGNMGHDVLAVFDISPGENFGKLVAFRPVGGETRIAHHTNYELPPDNVLYANDWLADKTIVWDLTDPRHPRVLRTIGGVGKYSYPHTFVYLHNGDTLTTFQYAYGFNKAAGGLVEFSPHGRVVRSSSAANVLDKNTRPYSLAVSEKLDRVVTGSADMMGAQESRVVQVWRLSDLKLLATLRMPASTNPDNGKAADSSEPRTLSDGTTILVPTFNCGLYLVKGLSTGTPSLHLVYDFGDRVCEVPVVYRNYLVMAAESAHALISLDVSDPHHPREVSHLYLGADQYPHWISLEPGANRLLIAGFGELATQIRFASVDPATGHLTLDARSLNLVRAWPDGWNGAIIPHGTVFSNE